MTRNTHPSTTPRSRIGRLVSFDGATGAPRLPKFSPPKLDALRRRCQKAVLGKDGWKALTNRSIAERAGVSEDTFSRHYNGVTTPDINQLFSYLHDFGAELTDVLA